MKERNAGKVRGRKRSVKSPPKAVQHDDARRQQPPPRAARKRSKVPSEPDPAVLQRELQRQQAELEITKRELRAAQTALEESSQRYAELYENAPIGYVTLDAKGVIRDANHVAADLLCLKCSELLGKAFGACLERGQRALIFRYVNEFLAHDKNKTLEVRMRCAGGALRDVRLSGVAQTDTAFGARACRIALSDVRDEKQRQETLRLHSLIMDHIIEGVVLVRAADNIILETNPPFERMFGYGADELIGRHISVLNAANTETPRDVAARIVNSLKHLGRWEGEVHNIRKDGSKFWSQATVTGFVHSAHGQVWVSVQRDITDRKRAEQQVRERQNELAHVLRLNTVGELAATLAHELTQPVMAIEHFNHAAIGLAESGSGTREELLQLLRSADQQVKRAGDVIRQLRKFVRRGVVEKKPISLPRTIEDALLLLHPMIVDHGVEVHGECGADIPQVNADPVQIEQVLVNLLRNCIEAMATLDRAPRRIDISCMRHADRIEVIVRDNGPGLDPAREATLFDVLESDKVDGMGMGLAISRSIIQAHSGNLWAEPATAGCATFHFTLPVCTQHEVRST